MWKSELRSAPSCTASKGCRHFYVACLGLSFFLSLSLFFKDLLHDHVCFACMYVWAPCTYLWKLYMVVSLCVGAGNQTQLFCKKKHIFFLFLFVCSCLIQSTPAAASPPPLFPVPPPPLLSPKSTASLFPFRREPASWAFLIDEPLLHIPLASFVRLTSVKDYNQFIYRDHLFQSHTIRVSTIRGMQFSHGLVSVPCISESEWQEGHDPGQGFLGMNQCRHMRLW